jgi:hypothetical protein
MRSSRLAAMLVLCAPVLSAQQVKREVTPRDGALDAQIDYSNGADSWISTSRPAYVALFDVSRTGVVQLYPTFSAQARVPVGTERRLISVPPSSAHGSGAPLSGGSFAALNEVSVGGRGWPHVLLLVASTSPLRVGSSWATNITLNHDLYQQHHFTDVQSDAGIAALVDLIRPVDPNAEMAFDRIEGIQARTTQYSSVLGFDATKATYLSYDCWSASKAASYSLALSSLAAQCIQILPVTGPTARFGPPTDSGTNAKSTRTIAESRRTADAADARRNFDFRTAGQATQQPAHHDGSGQVGPPNQSFDHSDGSDHSFGSGAARASQATNPASVRAAKPR